MRTLIRWSLIVVVIGLGLSVGWLLSATTVQSRPQAPLIIYDDALENGWTDYGSWLVTVNYGNTTPRHGGTASISRRSFATVA